MHILEVRRNGMYVEIVPAKPSIHGSPGK